MVLGLKTIGKTVQTIFVKGPQGLANLVKNILKNPEVIVKNIQQLTKNPV